MDGRLIVTWSRDGTAHLWNRLDGSPVGKPMKHGESISEAVFELDGGSLLTFGKNMARIWDVTADYAFHPSMYHY
jgi:hypothetical protein